MRLCLDTSIRYPRIRTSGSDLESYYLQIELCQKSDVASLTGEWRDQRFTRKIECPMNIEVERIFLVIAFGVHDASRLVVPRFLHRWNGC
jgi:hypothetical protein